MSVAHPANLARVAAGLLLLVVGVRLWVAGGLAIDSLGLALRAGDYMWFVPWSPPTAAAVGGMVGAWVLVGRLGWVNRLSSRGRLGAAALGWLAVGGLVAGLAVDWVWPPPVAGVALAAGIGVVGWWVFGRHGFVPPWAGPWRWLVWGLAAAMPLVAWWGIFGGAISNADSLSQVSQARLLATGRVAHDLSPALRAVVQIVYATPTVPSFSQYPPGHLLLMVPAVWAGWPPQVVNGIGAGALVLLTAALARRVAGGQGVAAGVLMATSPFFLVMAGEAMNHVTAAACLAGAALCLLPRLGHGWAAPSVRAAGLAGVLLGWAAITRPLPVLAQGAVWLSVWVWSWWRESEPTHRRALARAMGAVALGAAGPLAIGAAYNLATTGVAWQFGYSQSMAEMHVLGFRAEGPFPHGPGRALDHLAATLLSAWWQVGGWWMGCGVLAGVAWWRWRGRPGECVLAWLVAAQLAVFGLYHYFDLYLGPRFQFEVLAFAVVLLARPVETALRRRATRALALVLFGVLALHGAADGLRAYHHKFLLPLGLEARLRVLIDRHAGGAGPWVLVAPRPASELTGRWFPALPGERPLWVVPEEHREAARALPELAGAEWVEWDAGALP